MATTKFGIPYHFHKWIKNQPFSKCPRCEALYLMVPKDDESHQLSPEAIEHFMKEHGE